MKFDAASINKAYGLKDDDSEAYRAIFRSPDSDKQDEAMETKPSDR